MDRPLTEARGVVQATEGVTLTMHSSFFSSPSLVRLRTGLRDLERAMYRDVRPLEHARILPLGSGISPQELPLPPDGQAGWLPIQPGDRWGGIDQNIWLRAQVTLPQLWLDQVVQHGGVAVVLRILLGANAEGQFGWPEGLLYINGRLFQGVNRHHLDVLLPRDRVISPGGVLRLDIRAWSGLYHPDHRLEYAEVALLDRQVESLYHLLACGADAAEALSPHDPLRHTLTQALVDAYNRLDMETPSSPTFVHQAAEALTWLRSQLVDLKREFTPLHRPLVTLVGHGHLDVAWLWQTRHTREKAARTFSIATTLMDSYPEYIFLHTTPQVFAWLKQDYPGLYQRVKTRIAEGRFEAAGALWLETDCNLVSGESLVRQILYGDDFLREEFGRSYDVLWLPDTFGYSAALPQIMLRSGLRSFMTIKLSWNDTNRMPADTFRWRGIDGSEVLAHFLTTPTPRSASPTMDQADTYNGAVDVFSVTGAWDRYRQKAMNDEVLLAFGHGDGGGGPTRQQLEAAQAIGELPGVPELRFGRADEFFTRLRERVWQDDRLPIWDGELYLEYHRGTYTSQAWLKRLHRQCEQRLLLAETLDAWQSLAQGNSAPDRRPLLDEAWRTLLLHEFHDILPGSSIGPVYADAREALTQLSQQLNALINSTLTAVAGAAQGIIAFNPTPWPSSALIEVSTELVGISRTRRGASRERWVDSRSGQPLPTQTTRRDEAETLLVEVPAIPGLGFITLLPETAKEHGSARAASEEDSEPARGNGGDVPVLENQYFSLRFNHYGEITSFTDKRVPGGRELLPVGSVANTFEAFDDRPQNFDAWDIDATYSEKRYPLYGAEIGPEIELVENGPLRATMKIQRSLLSSSIHQYISVYRGEPRVDFVTRIDWHDQHVLLKVAFPLDLRARQATYETQYGVVERPTHRNTSWDQARFETPAHRFVDLSESNYGVSLLNDGCYGHDIRDNTLRLTLLRSATYPDPEADQGEHLVTYSLYPHIGDWRSGGTVQAAYKLNRPVTLVQARHGRDISAAPDAAGSDTGISNTAESSGGSGAFLRATPENVVIETLKRKKDGDGYVVRLYESHGIRCVARIECQLPCAGVIECDLLERPLTAEGSPAYQEWWASNVASHEHPVWEGSGWSCELRPFEIRSFLLSAVAPA